MTASFSRNFDGPLRLRLPKQLLHLRRNDELMAPTPNISRRERPVADHPVYFRESLLLGDELPFLAGARPSLEAAASFFCRLVRPRPTNFDLIGVFGRLKKIETKMVLCFSCGTLIEGKRVTKS